MTRKERSIENIKRILVLLNCEKATEDVVRACENCSKPDWVSVEDRLPSKDEGGFYLVAFKNGQIHKRHCYGGEFVMNRANQITHWMPLPEKPQK